MIKFERGSKFRIMTRDQVRSVDSWAIKQMKVPGVVLMENAGRSCAEYIIGRFRKIHNPRVCIFCGTGNNGGDGFVIARHLYNRAYAVRVIVFGDPAKIAGDALVNYQIISSMQLDMQILSPHDNISETVNTCTANCHVIVDALLGTGLFGHLKPEHIELIEAINSQAKPVIAVDIPSGLDCDTGEPLGAAIKAAATVTFVTVKKGFVTKTASPYLGELYIASIGIEPPAQLPE